tara:strand:- start:133 stop:861 length:729 start_codon:yes stop_codon:yes gene_type:complete
MDPKISLENPKNYKNTIKNKTSCLKNFLNTMNFILKYIDDHTNIKTNKKYIILRGLETFINIYKILLLYTKNTALIEEQCKCSIFYFVEFVGQIKLDTNLYLQLNSKDATIFVYKKTIFKINKSFKKTLLKNDNEFLKKFNFLVDFYILVFKKFIENDEFNNKFYDFINILQTALSKEKEILPNLYTFFKIIKHLEFNNIIKLSRTFIIKNNKKKCNFSNINRINKCIENKRFQLLFKEIFP